MPAKDAPPRTDPALLSTEELGYYRDVWGFDPLENCLEIGNGWHRYELCNPLAQDSLLYGNGVTICARVDWINYFTLQLGNRPELTSEEKVSEVWDGLHGKTPVRTELHNRIVFRQGDREATVECTHTLVNAGPAARGLTFAEDVYIQRGQLSKADQAWMQRGGGPVALPPWEHFAALKSFVAAIAEMGIFS